MTLPFAPAQSSPPISRRVDGSRSLTGPSSPHGRTIAGIEPPGQMRQSGERDNQPWIDRRAFPSEQSSLRASLPPAPPIQQYTRAVHFSNVRKSLTLRVMSSSIGKCRLLEARGASKRERSSLPDVRHGRRSMRCGRPGRAQPGWQVFVRSAATRGHRTPVADGTSRVGCRGGQLASIRRS